MRAVIGFALFLAHEQYDELKVQLRTLQEEYAKQQLANEKLQWRFDELDRALKRAP